MATAPRAQPEEPAGEEEQPLTRLEELRLRLQVEQEAMDLEEFVGTVDLDAAAVVVPRGRQREAKPSWLKHNASFLNKSVPNMFFSRNANANVRSQCQRINKNLKQIVMYKQDKEEFCNYK